MAQSPEQFAGKVRREAREARRPSPFLRQVAALARADAKVNFSRGVSPDDTPWLPLAHPRPGGGKGGPLKGTGKLERAATVEGAPGHVTIYRGNSVEVGADLPGASTHQYGATIVPKQAEWLAIPLTAAAAAVGRARNFPGTLHAVFGKVGGVLLDEDDVAQYALTKSVTVPKRPFVGAGKRLLAKFAELAAKFGVKIFTGGETRQ